MSIRSGKKYSSDLSLQEPIGTDRDGNEIAMIDILSGENDSIIDDIAFGMQVKTLYEKMKDVLKDREKLVLKLRYGLYNSEEMTQREIAKQLGISRSYVSGRA